MDRGTKANWLLGLAVAGLLVLVHLFSTALDWLGENLL